MKRFMQILYNLAVMLVIVTTVHSHTEISTEQLKKIFGHKAVESGNMPSYSVVFPRIQKTSNKERRSSEDTEDYMIEGLAIPDMMVKLKHNSKLVSPGMVIESQLPNGKMVSLGIPVSDCYYTGTMMDGSGTVAISQCNNDMMGLVMTQSHKYIIHPVESGGGEDSPHVMFNADDWSLINGTTERIDDTMCYMQKEFENGEVTFSDIHLGSTAHYTCNDGYTLIGPATRECLITGTWSGYTPVCVANSDNESEQIIPLDAPCPALMDPNFGAVTTHYDSTIDLFVAKYTCKEDYTIIGDSQRYCLESRYWSGREPYCVAEKVLARYSNSQSHSPYGRSARSVVNKTMELMLYIDTTLINNRGGNVAATDYVLSIMNIVSSLYRDPTLEDQIDLSIISIILEMPGNELNIVADGEVTLDTFCAFQQTVNPAGDDNPMHFDYAILITGVDLCFQDDGVCNPGLLGIAPVAGVCSTTRNCNINQDIGLSTAFVITHEVGHGFSMRHDGDGNDCPTDSDLIMDAILGGGSGLFQWSNCSADYLNTFLNAGNGVCLEDEPPAAATQTDPTALPGLTFDADAQCQAQMGPDAFFCTGFIDDVCSLLRCGTSSTGNSCFNMGTPAASGTTCGTNMICVRGSCIPSSTDLTPVDGQWGGFGPFSACTRSCGIGVRYRERQCNNPTPQFGGNYCAGEARTYKTCNTQACPADSPSFRAVQCTATNSVPFEDQLHTWLPFTVQEIVSTLSPCALVCQSAETSQRVLRSNTVTDGTPCYSGSFDHAVCIEGRCTIVGCDNVLESGMEADACGVCNGNNSLATLVTDSSSAVVNFGYNDITIIPSGARHVSIMDDSTSGNIFIAIAVNGDQIINGDLTLVGSGHYSADGDEYDYNGANAAVETVTSTGPLVNPVTVQVLSGSNDVLYSFSWQYYTCAAVGCHLSANCADATITDPSVTMDACCMSNGQSFSNKTGCHMCPSSTDILGDPHFVVPLRSKKSLCYSIQGYPGLAFNLISNKHFVINAQFIDSNGDSNEASWIGKLSVILQNKNESNAVVFSSVDQDVSIVNKASFKAKVIKQIIFTRNGSINVTQRLVIPSGNPIVHIVFDDPQAKFDITFYKNHLNVDWKMQYDEFPDMQGLMGQFMKKGIEIDAQKKMLIYSDDRDPVPVNEDFVMAGKACWKSMNYGNHGEGLIQGNILDYVMENILETKTKLKTFK